MFRSLNNAKPGGGDKVSEFGEWIRLKRRFLGLTQTECAERAGMKVQQWSRMEKQVARPAYNTLVSVAHVLCVSLEEMLTVAGYEVQRPESVESRIGKRLEPLLRQADPRKLPAIEAALESVVRAMVAA